MRILDTARQSSLRPCSALLTNERSEPHIRQALRATPVRSFTIMHESLAHFGRHLGLQFPARSGGEGPGQRNHRGPAQHRLDHVQGMRCPVAVIGMPNGAEAKHPAGSRQVTRSQSVSARVLTRQAPKWFIGHERKQAIGLGIVEAQQVAPGQEEDAIAWAERGGVELIDDHSASSLLPKAIALQLQLVDQVPVPERDGRRERIEAQLVLVPVSTRDRCRESAASWQLIEGDRL
jgi:hypothetical protein